MLVQDDEPTWVGGGRLGYGLERGQRAVARGGKGGAGGGFRF